MVTGAESGRVMPSDSGRPGIRLQKQHNFSLTSFSPVRKSHGQPWPRRFISHTSSAMASALHQPCFISHASSAMLHQPWPRRFISHASSAVASALHQADNRSISICALIEHSTEAVLHFLPGDSRSTNRNVLIEQRTVAGLGFLPNERDEVGEDLRHLLAQS